MSVPFVPGTTVEVPEIPYKKNVSLPAKKSALIIVDMQNDFVKPGGTLVVDSAQATIKNVQRLSSAARSAGMPVVYTQDTHFEGDREWTIWPEHCRNDSWGWQIIEELAPQRDDLVCQKNRYDGFYGTWLEHFLTNVWHAEHLVITGTVSSICVLHTAASAGLRWFDITIPADGVSAITEFDQAMTLRQVSFLYTGSVVRSVDDLRFV